MARVLAGRYEISEIVGRGGMGDVYSGYDLLTDERIAIKALKPEIVEANPSIVERFEREGEALRQLNHPSIVKMLGTVQEDGRQYIILDYVSGGSLRDLLNKEKRLSIKRTLEIGLDLADALTRAHRLSIIHRDIKPENVLIAEDGTPRLTDFGTAHLGDRTRVTEEGSVIGTYAYLSPEACFGAELDARTDIWSFGVMLYEMLAGRRPFDATQPGALVTAIVSQPHPSVKEFRPEVPDLLAQLIDDMLEKTRDNRLSSVRLVGAELESIIQNSESAIRSADSMPRLPGPMSGSSDHSEDMRSASTRNNDSTVLLSQIQRFNQANRVLTVTLAVLVIVALGIVGSFAISNRDPDAIPIVPGAPEITGTEPIDAIIQVEQVEPGETMILVAQFEQLGGESQDIRRLVTDDLRQTLEVGVPYSTVRIRPYPAIVTEVTVARDVAEANNAAVIVWGNYDSDTVAATVQMGSLTGFPLIALERSVVESTANVEIRLSSARDESLAPQVLGVLAVLYAADGDGYEIMRTFAALDQIEVTGGEIDGNTVAANTHRYMESFFDTAIAIEYIDAAIALESNPILYAYRGMARFRLSLYEDSLEDARTAARLGPDGWTTPAFVEGNYYLRGTDESFREFLPQAIAGYDLIVEQRPGEWFPYNTRGSLQYLEGNYDAAEADFETALSLEPNANFPYAFATMIAFREGRMEDGKQLMDTVLTEFPDPSFGLRILQAINNDMGATNIFGPVYSAFGNVALGQFNQAVSDAEAGLAMNELSDLYLMQGYAYCNLGELDAAEEAYSLGIEADPSFALLYLLRADVRFQSGDSQGGTEDIVEARLLASSLEFNQYVDAIESQELTCATIFTEGP